MVRKASAIGQSRGACRPIAGNTRQACRPCCLKASHQKRQVLLPKQAVSSLLLTSIGEVAQGKQFMRSGVN